MFKIIAVLGLIGIIPIQAEDWVVNGRTFNDVKVAHVYDDHVAITFSTGIGNFMLSDLSPELQKRFNYDPEKSAVATKVDEEAKAKAIAELQANPPKPIAVPVNVVVPVQKKTVQPIDADRLAEIASRIAALEADIQEKEKISSHEHQSGYVGNGYKDAIADERQELVILRSQMASGR